MIDLIKKRDKQFFNILNQSSDFYGIADISGQAVFINESGKKILGLKEQDISAQSMFDFFGDDRDLFNEDFYQKALSSQDGTSKGEIHFRHFDSQKEILFELNFFIFFDDKGTPAYFMAFAKILEKKRTQEQRLIRENDFKQALLNSLEDGVLVIDHKSRKITTVNERFYEMWLIPEELKETMDDEKLINHVLSQLSNSDDFLNKVIDLYEKPYERSHDTLDFQDGRVFERHSYPVIQKNEAISRIWTFRDITEKTNQARELLEQKKLASHNARLASIGELAAGVGHEINNPLTIVKGYLSTMQEEINENNFTLKGLLIYIDKIMHASIRIEKVVRGLRNFTRFDSSEFENFSATTAIEESYNMIEEIYNKEGIDLKLNNNADKVHQIKGSREKFQQIIVNLISNAKYATKGNSVRSIDLNTQIKNQKYIVKVKDNGCGINKFLQEKIFDPFFTTKEINDGTGIGLSLACNFAEEMNGILSVESEDGKGATFTIEIPLSIDFN